MRLLMISDVYFPRVNGVSTSIETTRHALEKLGHEVTLIVPDYPHQEESTDPYVLRIPARKVLLDPEDRLMAWRDLRRTMRAIAPQKFDLIHIHTPFIAHYAGTRMARNLKIPVVETYHTFFEQYLEHYIPFLPDPMLRLMARRLTANQGNAVNALISPSIAMRDILRRYGVLTPISVIPTGIDLEQWRTPTAPDPRGELGLNATQPMLLFVGRLAFEKNVEFLLNMLTKLIVQRPDTRLVLAGEGPAEKHLRKITAQLGLDEHVHFVGYLPRDGQLQALYRAADAFVFASATETQGLVLVEALALGLPVVALAEMGTRDVVREGEGCLIAPNTLQGFADRVLELLNHPHKAAQLAAQAVIAADAWQEERVAERLVAFYQETIDRGESAPARKRWRRKKEA
ncbi:MAG TPA: glycosyltransferase family 4 protein [bacterium]|nr:glycosyltransferase family 4 protein [bacterium]